MYNHATSPIFILSRRQYNEQNKSKRVFHHGLIQGTNHHLNNGFLDHLIQTDIQKYSKYFVVFFHLDEKAEIILGLSIT